MLPELKSTFQTQQKPREISFEFFPPKNDEAKKIFEESVINLAKLNPNFMTVTYGAGGSTKDKTLESVEWIKKTTNIDVASHLTCVGVEKQVIEDVLNLYNTKNINHIVALRGDMPGFEGEYKPHPNGLAYATDLVKFIKKNYNFEISVAGYPEAHPQAKSLEEDLRYLQQKIENGASRIMTQYCFDTDLVLNYIEKVRKLNINAKIAAGIVVISNFKQIEKFSKQCGASIPKWLKNLCDNIDDTPEIRGSVATYIAAEQCRRLLSEGVEDFHFYTLNRWQDVAATCKLAF